MQPQEILDQCARHLFKQGRPSITFEDGNRKCMYRAPDGCQCAVGVFIPHDEYDQEMDENANTAINHIIDEFAFPKFFKKNIVLLDHLQVVHDKCDLKRETGEFDRFTLAQRLKKVAETHLLDKTVIEACLKEHVEACHG